MKANKKKSSGLSETEYRQRIFDQINRWIKNEQNESIRQVDNFSKKKFYFVV